MARTTAFQVNNDHHSNTYAAWVSPEQRQLLLELLWELEAIEEAWRERQQTTPTDIIAAQINQVWRDDDRRFSMWDACDREDLSDEEIADYHAERDSNEDEEIIGVEPMASTRPVHRTNQERGRRRQQPKPGRHLRSARNARRDISVGERGNRKNPYDLEMLQHAIAQRDRLFTQEDLKDDGTPADDLTFAQHDALYWGQKSLSVSQVQAEHPAALHKRPRKPRSQRSWVDTDEVVVPQRPRVLYGWVSPRQKSSDYYTLNKGMKRMYGVQV